MKTHRLEAFSDGVLAIIITIMVLELKVPHVATFAALAALWPVALSYTLSFIYVGIYWNNHHHMMIAADEVTGGVLWANLHFLFWISLLPFCTAWMGENHFEKLPTIVYGADLLACAIAYYILQRTIMAVEGPDGAVTKAVGGDRKGRYSPLAYISGILAAWLVAPWMGMAFFVAAALMWIVPDRRIERVVQDEEAEDEKARDG